MADLFTLISETVPRTELVAYLTENIADQARVDMQLSSDRQGKEVNASAYGTPMKLAEQRSLTSTGEVHLLTSETGKKQLARTRNLIAGKAEAAIASRIDALKDAVSLMIKFSPAMLTRDPCVIANLRNRDCRRRFLCIVGLKMGTRPGDLQSRFVAAISKQEAAAQHA